VSDVFISYSRHNADFVQWLHGELTGAGVTAWVDWADIPPASEWERDIESNIDAADSVLFVISSSSLASPYCSKELEKALASNKRLVPVACERVGTAGAALALRHLNWIWCVDEEHKPEAIEKIHTALTTDLEWTRAHTRLLVLAATWMERDEDKSLLLRGRDLRDAEALLAAHATNEPAPTVSQHRFVAESRKAASRRTRLAFLAVLFSLVLSLVLGTLAEVQRHNAQVAERAARHNESVALKESHIAQVNSLLREKAALAAARASADATTQHARALASQRIAALERNEAALSAAGYDAAILGTVANQQSSSALDVALMAGLRATQLRPGSASSSALISGLESASATGLTSELEGDTSTITLLMTDTSGDAIVAANANGTLDLWTDAGFGTQKLLHPPASTTAVPAMAFNHAHNVLAVGTSSGFLDLFSVPGGRLLSTTRVADDTVTSLAFSPTDTYLAAGSSGTHAYVFRVPRTRQLSQPPLIFNAGRSAWTVGFATVAGSPQLLIGDGSIAVTSWPIRPNASPLLYESLTSGLLKNPNSLVLSPNGHFVANVTTSGVAIYPIENSLTSNFVSPTALTTITDSSGTAARASVVFNAASSKVAVGFSDGTVRECSLLQPTTTCHTTVEDSAQSSVPSLAGWTTSSGHEVLVSATGGVVQIWGDPSRRTMGTDAGVNDRRAAPGLTTTFDAAFSAGARYVVTNEESTGPTTLWHLSSASTNARVLVPQPTHTPHVFCGPVSLGPSPDVFALNCYGAIDLYEHSSAPRGLANPHIAHADAARVSSLAFSPSGAYLLAGYSSSSANPDDTAGYDANGFGSAVELWSLHGTTPVARVVTRPRAFPPGLNAVVAVAFSPNGYTFAVGYDEGTEVFSSSTRAPLAWLPAPSGATVSTVTYSPRSDALVIGSSNGEVQVWKYRSGHSLFVRGPSAHVASSIAVSPAGNIIAVGASDDSVVLVDAATGTQLGASLLGDASPVDAVSFTSDGRTVLVAYADGHVRRWSGFLWTSAANARALVCADIDGAIGVTRWSQYVPTVRYKNVCA